MSFSNQIQTTYKWLKSKKYINKLTTKLRRLLLHKNRKNIYYKQMLRIAKYTTIYIKLN